MWFEHIVKAKSYEQNRIKPNWKDVECYPHQTWCLRSNEFMTPTKQDSGVGGIVW